MRAASFSQGDFAHPTCSDLTGIPSNSLTVAVGGRIDESFRSASLADLAILDITTDLYTDQHAWNETLSLADRFKLTLYDAAYLELATAQPSTGRARR